MDKTTEKTNRLIILENSLEKKEAEFTRRLDNHMSDVRRANGQPLNDKRNGHVTLNRWEKQNDSLRNLQKSIEKTKDAIEREKSKIRNVSSVKLPKEIQQLLDEGKITQWRKYPNRFFVVGVEKARIVLLEDEQTVAHQYLSQIPKGTGQFEVFRDVFNGLNRALNSRKAEEGERNADH